MSEILFQYDPVKPTTWAYLASLLTVALFFKFNRIFSIRNLDLAGLILLAPALLMVQFGAHRAAGDETARFVAHVGYIWLFSVNGLIMIRLLLDAFMVRRPLLEPNLTAGGLTFLGVSLFLFLIGNVVTRMPAAADLNDSQRADRLCRRVAFDRDAHTLATLGPAYPLLYVAPYAATHAILGTHTEDERFTSGEPGEPVKPVRFVHVATARIMAILAQMAIVVGLVVVGTRHFDNIRTGVAIATLYLLLPGTAMWTGNVTQALPGALLVWAVAMYRRPAAAGFLLGLACGTIYYPLFLLPLWISFYWERGVMRLIIGLAAALAVLAGVVACTSIDVPSFLANVRQLSGIGAVMAADAGVWGEFWRPAYRYPLVAAHVGLCLSMVLWPAQKNLGTLISYTAAAMLGTQFWHAHHGGLALAWYVPLLLLTIFRPNLEDRVAMAVVK